LKIEIKDFDEKITLSNDELDNSHYVDITLQSDVDDEEGEGEDEMIRTMIVPLDQLYAAVSAFKELEEPLYDVKDDYCDCVGIMRKTNNN